MVRLPPLCPWPFVPEGIHQLCTPQRGNPTAVFRKGSPVSVLCLPGPGVPSALQRKAAANEGRVHCIYRPNCVFRTGSAWQRRAKHSGFSWGSLRHFLTAHRWLSSFRPVFVWFTQLKGTLSSAGWTVSPQIHVYSKPQNVTLAGNRVLADVTH